MQEKMDPNIRFREFKYCSWDIRCWKQQKKEYSGPFYWHEVGIRWNLHICSCGHHRCNPSSYFVGSLAVDLTCSECKSRYCGGSTCQSSITSGLASWWGARAHERDDVRAWVMCCDYACLYVVASVVCFGWSRSLSIVGVPVQCGVRCSLVRTDGYSNF